MDYRSIRVIFIIYDCIAFKGLPKRNMLFPSVCMTSTNCASDGSSRTCVGIPWKYGSAGSRPVILPKPYQIKC